MNKKPPLTVIGYYTDDRIYRQHFEILERCFIKFGITYDYDKIPVSSWLAATAYKPSLILEKLRNYKQPVLYLDVDCYLHEDISEYFLRINADLGAHYLKGNNELGSGTLYFNYNARTIELLERWIEGMHENPTVWDQKVLQQILESNSVAGLQIEEIPHRYLYIFDSSKLADPNLSPAIEHLQASREVRYQAKMDRVKSRILALVGVKPKVGDGLAARRRRLREILDLLER